MDQERAAHGAHAAAVVGAALGLQEAREMARRSIRAVGPRRDLCCRAG